MLVGDTKICKWATPLLILNSAQAMCAMPGTPKECSHHFCECSCHKKMAFYTFYSALWSFLMHFSTLSGKETIFLLHRYSVSREKSDYVYVSAEPYAWSELKSSLSKAQYFYSFKASSIFVFCVITNWCSDLFITSKYPSESQFMANIWL